MSSAKRRSQERLRILAGVLGILGLATAALFVIHSTPYTMIGLILSDQR